MSAVSPSLLQSVNGCGNIERKQNMPEEEKKIVTPEEESKKPKPPGPGVRRITLTEWRSLLKGQGVPRVHLAFKCPICKTIQSGQDFIDAGAGKTFEEVDTQLGFSCVGRHRKSGPFQKGDAPGKGCDWTLGGLFQFHLLEVIDDEGRIQRSFEVAKPEEAQAHMAGRGAVK